MEVHPVALLLVHKRGRGVLGGANGVGGAGVMVEGRRTHRAFSSTREEMEHSVSTAIATNSAVRKRSANFGREMPNATVSAWTPLAQTFLQIALASWFCQFTFNVARPSQSRVRGAARPAIKFADLIMFFLRASKKSIHPL